jgi:methylthioribose-1-phosphate isomerase
MIVNGKHYRTVWFRNGVVRMINQPLLPHRFEIAYFRSHRETADAITRMVTRGAGAIGASAGYAMAQGIISASEKDFEKDVQEAAAYIRNARPTAQDLFYAVDRVLDSIKDKPPAEARDAAVQEAESIADENSEACKRIGELGAGLIGDGFRIGTHCNAGWLAFVDWGSAISPIYAAKRQGKDVFVWVDETRPRCQGAMLTSWELAQEGIPHCVIADNAAGYYMRRGEVDMFIVGSDRIAANGDVANKIGTYTKAVLCRENGIPFYVAAPTSTIDRKSPDGESIPIEERDEEEVLCVSGWGGQDRPDTVRIAPKDARARNPAFDVTPAGMVKGIITEKGIVEASEKGIAGLFRD